LTAGEQRRYDLTALGSEDANHPAHLQAHIALNGAGIRELKFLLRAGEESVGDQSGLGGPPTVDSCLANVGVGGDSLDAQFRESTTLLEQLQSAAQDGLTRFLTARPPGRALPAGSVSSVLGPGAPGMILSHGKSLI
jgi:hypothetical protein